MYHKMSMHKLLGVLSFLTNCTRLGIAYAVNRLSKYTHNPNNEHWIAICRILKYLKGTMDYCILFTSSPFVIDGYSDANWISDSDEINSISGFVYTLSGGAATWKSSEQTCITHSIMESELIALDLASAEAD